MSIVHEMVSVEEVKKNYLSYMQEREKIYAEELGKYMQELNNLLAKPTAPTLTIFLSNVQDWVTDGKRAFEDIEVSLSCAGYTVEDATGRGEPKLVVSGWAC